MEKLTAEHPLSKSEDLVKQNIETLKSLFPTIVKEGKIDLEELKAVLGEEIESGDEFYRFNWAGKSMARQEANKPSTATLRPNKAESKDWDTTGNIFIEGDNLEVLKLLQKSYANQIKMIYIDPPYNTGKDFVYKDNYADNLSNYLTITGQTDEEGRKLSSNAESDGRYHSNWLNMMYPRLKLARNLLKEDGVIFISIDDNEVANLRKLCDEIFGEENFIGLFIINSSPSAIDYGHIAKMNDYALFYSKNALETSTQHLTEEEKVFKYTDQKGPFNIYPLYNGNVAFNPKTRPNLYYPFYLNPKNKIDKDFYEIGLEKKDGWVEVYPVISQRDGIQRVWRWGKPKSKEGLNDEIVGYKTENGEFRVVQKTRLTGKMIRSLQLDTDISSRRGTRDVEDLFGSKIFTFPKPVELIRRFSAVSTVSEDIVLDFFSGSGSTAEAIMRLNAEDISDRKFICVQLPESLSEDTEAYKAGYKTIADITKERIRRAGEKIKSELKSDLFSSEGKTLDIGFKAFKLDTSNIIPWDGSLENFEKNLFNSTSNIKPDRTEEDVLFEVLLKSGLDLTQAIEERLIGANKVFNIGYGTLFICLSDAITTATAEEIGKWKEEIQPAKCRVIFKDTGFTDVEKTNSIQILKRYGITEVNSI